MERAAEKSDRAGGHAPRRDPREGTEERVAPAACRRLVVLCGGRVVEPGQGHDQAPEGSQDGEHDERVHEPSAGGPEGGEGHGARHGGGRLAHRLERDDAQERVVDDQVEDGDPQDAQTQAGGEMPPRVLDLSRHVGHVDPAVIGEEDRGHPESHQPDEAGESRPRWAAEVGPAAEEPAGAAKSRLPTTRDSRPTILTVVRTTWVRPPHLMPCRFTTVKKRIAAAPQPAAESVSVGSQEEHRELAEHDGHPRHGARDRSPTSRPRS